MRVVGPRGGFKYLSYEYTSEDGIQQHVSTAFRSDADELVDLFERYGITVAERKL